jgi:hypothetical protein
MNTATAPSQLPFAPRPFAEELFSSWMLRVANANCVSLQELVLGFQSRHPDVPGPNVLDWGLPDGFLKAISRFSRTPIGTLHALDLRARLPTVETALLLRGQAVSDQSQRLRNILKTAKCPFANLPELSDGRWGAGLTAKKMKECVWLKPEAVAQVAFLEWTGAETSASYCTSSWAG